jgi:preprotein translocase subunit SecA
VQRGHYYAIIDEVDNILIDEARTPLIISGPSHEDSEWYIRMAQIVKQLLPEDYEISEKDRTVTLSEIGLAHVEELLGMPLRDPERPEDITPEQARLLGFLEQALRAEFLFHLNKEYIVQNKKWSSWMSLPGAYARSPLVRWVAPGGGSQGGCQGPG